MIGRTLWIAVTILAIATRATAVEAEEIRVLSPVAMRAAMPQIAAQFETASGHKLRVEYATAGAIVDRVKKGEVADAAIASTAQIDALLSEGRIVAGSRSQFARVGVGVFVRNGAVRPDLTSVDNFKRALLEATTIGYGDPAKGGVSGIAMAALVERLSIAADLRAKTRLFPDSQAVLTAVAAGDVFIGVGLTSDTVLAAGVELAGGLPTEVQSFTYYAGGVVSGSKQVDAASKFAAFLTSPAAKAVFSAKGFEPQ
jgi:molybdate transport system substrate-binding protein